MTRVKDKLTELNESYQSILEHEFHVSKHEIEMLLKSRAEEIIGILAKHDGGLYSAKEEVESIARVDGAKRLLRRSQER